MWYSDLAVAHVGLTAHPSTASVPITV